jgi:hypothetical protein
MQPSTQTTPISKRRLWTGRILSGFAVLFLVFDAVIKFTKIAPVVDSFAQLGYPISLAPTIGSLALLCVVLYVIPRTSVLGAILLTGYLGGAVASQLRIGSPLLSHVLFPVYVAALIWGGLYLRDEQLSALVPVRR